MTTKEFVLIEQRLLPSFPGFSINKKLMFICPITDILRGFHFEPSAFSKKAFYVDVFFMPLYVPAKQIHFTFGHRVGVGKCWNADLPGLGTELQAEMKSELPMLLNLGTPKNIVRALESFANRKNPHSIEAFAYALIRAKEFTEAAKAIATLLNVIDTRITWQREIGARTQLIKERLATDPRDACKQLNAWQSETTTNLGVDRFC